MIAKSDPQSRHLHVSDYLALGELALPLVVHLSALLPQQLIQGAQAKMGKYFGAVLIPYVTYFTPTFWHH